MNIDRTSVRQFLESTYSDDDWRDLDQQDLAREVSREFGIKPREAATALRELIASQGHTRNNKPKLELIDDSYLATQNQTSSHDEFRSSDDRVISISETLTSIESAFGINVPGIFVPALEEIYGNTFSVHAKVWNAPEIPQSGSFLDRLSIIEVIAALDELQLMLADQCETSPIILARIVDGKILKNQTADPLVRLNAMMVFYEFAMNLQTHHPNRWHNLKASGFVFESKEIDALRVDTGAKIVAMREYCSGLKTRMSEAHQALVTRKIQPLAPADAHATVERFAHGGYFKTGFPYGKPWLKSQIEPHPPSQPSTALVAAANRVITSHPIEVGASLLLPVARSNTV